ncbi:uncharacterized protein LOC111342928 [Stylophora pistillata]|uniref:uncharacterized protein LOC111342928 n=1 Tax=Stylophora pistillata TaxID=50429 RepID=UPI000C047194|nr:uncharacterized protein LOC111342928 [Stylophora pistillata]XP_022805791.1 uncharacterized protein LOC111342928 [Stylophora pistillata]
MSGSEYLRSPAGVSKIAEFILLLSAFVIISLYNNYFKSRADMGFPRPDHMDRLSFFTTSTIILWLLVTLAFVFSLLSLSDRIGKKWNILNMGISIFSAVILLVSSSLLLNEVTHLSDYPTPLGKINLCQAQGYIGKQTCGHLQVSAICGLLAMLLFVGDFIYYFFKINNQQ